MRILRTGRWRQLGAIIALLLAIGPACADVTYTVRPGDTLAKLAARYSVPLNTLMAVNNVTDPDRIAVGQTLRIPTANDNPATTTDEAAAFQPAEPQRSGDARMTAVASRAFSARKLAEERAKFLAAQRQKQEQMSQSAGGNSLVAAARRYMGTPYVWGGTTSRGLDCSGLIVRAMLATGKNVPHQSGQLYRMGTPISRENLQAGDLLFFNTRGSGVSHVAIYIGENKFIHASSRGGEVRVDALEGYYSNRLVGARRIR